MLCVNEHSYMLVDNRLAVIGTEGDTHMALHSKQFVSCKRPLTPYMVNVGIELGISKSKDEPRNRKALDTLDVFERHIYTRNLFYVTT